MLKDILLKSPLTFILAPNLQHLPPARHHLHRRAVCRSAVEGIKIISGLVVVVVAEGADVGDCESGAGGVEGEAVAGFDVFGWEGESVARGGGVVDWDGFVVVSCEGVAVVDALGGGLVGGGWDGVNEYWWGGKARRGGWSGGSLLEDWRGGLRYGVGYSGSSEG